MTSYSSQTFDRMTTVHPIVGLLFVIKPMFAKTKE